MPYIPPMIPIGVLKPIELLFQVKILLSFLSAYYEDLQNIDSYRNHLHHWEALPLSLVL